MEKSANRAMPKKHLIPHIQILWQPQGSHKVINFCVPCANSVNCTQAKSLRLLSLTSSLSILSSCVANAELNVWMRPIDEMYEYAADGALAVVSSAPQ